MLKRIGIYVNAECRPGLIELVEKLKTETYTTTPNMSRNGQAVTIRFSDFVVDGQSGVISSAYRPRSYQASLASPFSRRHRRIFGGLAQSRLLSR
jgi:hypothetical protein